MSGSRPREFIAVTMVALAVVYAAVLFWAVTSSTFLSWTVFLLANVVLAIIGFALLFGRNRARVPASLAAPRPSDGITRLLVIADAGCRAPDLHERLIRSAGRRPDKALVVAPALASGLDWLTGDQAAYDRASGDLEAVLDALREAGIDADGHIGSRDPVQAAVDGLREFPADSIVVVGGADAPGEATALEQLREKLDIPVTRVAVGGA